MFVFYMLIIGGNDYAMVNFRNYGGKYALFEWLDAVQRGKTKKLNDYYSDEFGFEIEELKEFSFSTELDRTTAMEAIQCYPVEYDASKHSGILLFPKERANAKEIDCMDACECGQEYGFYDDPPHKDWDECLRNQPDLEVDRSSK